MSESIKFIRLQTGEDLISKVIEVEKDGIHSIILVDPMKLIYMTGSKQGVLAISMMQWVFSRICDTQEFVIYAEDIVTMADPSDAILTYYHNSIEHFSSYEPETEYETKNVFKDELDNEEERTPELDVDRLKEIIDTLKIDKKRLH